MTKTMNHRDCDHPATKAARATCRELRRSEALSRATLIQGIIDDYFANRPADELIGRILALGIELDPDATLEETVLSL